MSINLHTAVEALEGIAPSELAEDWDNVGLLVEPARPQRVRRVLLTIDLTGPVFDEAIEVGAELVVAYHPPIFKPLTRLAGRSVVTRAAERRVAIYSPHTALDAVPGGVNDWLAEGLGDHTAEPLQPREDQPEAGAGRTVTLKREATLQTLLRRIKGHLGLPGVRVAAAERHTTGEKIRHAAICPGAGGSLFGDLSEPELYLTGEMRHHDVLAKVAAGASVILTDHTNTERGYLPRLKQKLGEATGDKVEVHISERDADPLRIV